MAQFNKVANTFVNQNKSIYEVVMTADASGNLTSPVSGGRVSTLNSNSTPLAANTIWYGEWEDGSNFDSLVVAVNTDQNGRYFIQFSSDGSNSTIDSNLIRYYNDDKIEPPHRFTVTRQYFRIAFENSSTQDQTFFRLQTLVGTKNQLNIPLDATMSRDYDSVSTRPSDYKIESAAGRRQGNQTWHKWGYNADIDTGSQEMIWSAGGNMTFLTANSTLTISSSAASDNSSGTGARTLTLFGLDENRKEISEQISMNGAVPVVTTNQWLGINRVQINSCGAATYNQGNITVSSTIGSHTQAYVPANTSVTQQAIFFVPSKNKFMLNWFYLNANKIVASQQLPRINIYAYIFNFDNNVRREVYRTIIDTSVENTIEVSPDNPFSIESNSVIYFAATTDKDDTLVDVRFSGVLLEDVDEYSAT